MARAHRLGQTNKVIFSWRQCGIIELLFHSFSMSLIKPIFSSVGHDLQAHSPSYGGRADGGDY